MFLLVCVILLTRGCLPQCMLRYHPPGKETPPWKEAHDQKEAQPPERKHPLEGNTPPPWEGSTPTGRKHPPPAYRHTVSERPVRIPLECIIVGIIMMLFFILQKEYILTCDVCGCLWILPVSNVHEVHDFIPAVSCSS